MDCGTACTALWHVARRLCPAISGDHGRAANGLPAILAHASGTARINPWWQNHLESVKRVGLQIRGRFPRGLSQILRDVSTGIRQIRTAPKQTRLGPKSRRNCRLKRRHKRTNLHFQRKIFQRSKLKYCLRNSKRPADQQNFASWSVWPHRSGLRAIITSGQHVPKP
jgi:hypothetical protein